MTKPGLETAEKRAETQLKLHDKQSEPDTREIPIDKVGVRGLRMPIQIRDKAHVLQNTIATIGMYVDLPKEFKGTHMSRFIEVLHAHGSIVHVENITDILYAMQDETASPPPPTSRWSSRSSWSSGPGLRTRERDGLRGAVRRDGLRPGNRFRPDGKAPVTTLCPCSKAISRYGAHNQRGEVTVQLRSRQVVWIEEVIALIEASASAKLYALLKREDEKAVTERAYENPVFVEDLVRNVALRLKAHPEITWYKVEAENQESIHNHNAYACIEKG